MTKCSRSSWEVHVLNPDGRRSVFCVDSRAQVATIINNAASAGYETRVSPPAMLGGLGAMHAKSKRAYLITASCGKRTVGPYSATSAAERDNVKRQLRRSYPRCRVSTQEISVRPGGDRGLRGIMLGSSNKVHERTMVKDLRHAEDQVRIGRRYMDSGNCVGAYWAFARADDYLGRADANFNASSRARGPLFKVLDKLQEALASAQREFTRNGCVRK